MEEQVNYLLKAVWVQLRLVYYLNCNLWRQEKKNTAMRWSSKQKDNRKGDVLLKREQ